MRSNRRRLVSAALSALVLSGVLSAAGSAGADVVNLPYAENFQSPAPSADAAADYPEFDADFGGGGTATVDAAGVLHLASTGANNTQTFVVTPNSPTGEIVIRAQVGASQSDGNYNVGLVLGQNSLAFHPGFTPIPGAFRIDGPGGFGNSDMGFVPANGVLHQIEIHAFPNGDFDITVTDGSDPSNVYTASFNNPASYGGPYGLRRSGPASGDGQFDNFSIAPIPEPATAGLMALGLFGVVARRRRGR